MTDLKTKVPRLSLATLGSARPGTVTFSYDRRRLRPRLVHIGLGAFFRAHGALFTEDVLDDPDVDWGIVGASLRRPDQRDRLIPQDGLYTTVEHGANANHARIVGCLLDLLVGPENPAKLLEQLAGPETAIVTITITEKGYCHDPASGCLNVEHPDIRHDLEHRDVPRSAVGLITAALARRKAKGYPPFTVASCDNLPRNGDLLARLVREFASLHNEKLVDWIERTVPFPNSMVDRIVPAEGEGDLSLVEQLTGLHDAAPVMHEPFRQWVLEDRFLDRARPPWERAGVQFASDVSPFEQVKYRMLNASHSALAYLGYLAGLETIFDAVSDDLFGRFIKRFWREDVIPVLAVPPGMNLGQYADQLLQRFSNPAIRHRLWHIAMDGTQKLPPRFLSTVRANLSRNRTFKFVALAIAGWMRYVSGVDELGNPIAVQDPLLFLLRERLDSAGADPTAQVRALTNIEQVFGHDLPTNKLFMSAVTEAFAALRREGARKAIAVALART
jgi:fructuronate reductase